LTTPNCATERGAALRGGGESAGQYRQQRSKGNLWKKDFPGLDPSAHSTGVGKCLKTKGADLLKSEQYQNKELTEARTVAAQKQTN
jgi:hypothetical protein